MKNTYYTLLFLLLFSTISFSQSKGDFNFGLIAGGNYSIPYGDDITKNKDYIKSKADKGGIHPQLNVKIGGILDYSISDKVSINIGLTYTKRGWIEEYESSTGLTPYDTEYSLTFWAFNEAKVNYKLTYVDMPILLRLKIGEKLFLHGGFVYSFKTSDNVSYDFKSPSLGDISKSDYFINYFNVTPNDRVSGVQAGIDIHLGKGWNIDISAQRTGKILPQNYDVGFNTLSVSIKKLIRLNNKDE